MGNKNVLSGTCGSCLWKIEGEKDNRTLIFYPKNGFKGELSDRKSWRINNSPEFLSEIKKIEVKDGVIASRNLHGFFSTGPISNCEEIDLRGLDTSNVRCMDLIFSGNEKLKVLKFGTFDTKNVVSMNGMFENCKSLTDLNIEGFNTSKVVSMIEMFKGCESIEVLNLKNFDTYNVKDMSFMFKGCKNLKNLNISSFDKSNLEHELMMFSGCKNLEGEQFKSFERGTIGSCSWEISDDGKLRIFPSKGESGELMRPSFTKDRTNVENFPLFGSYNRCELIKEAVVEQGVVLKHSGARLFEGLLNCKKLDLKGLDISEIDNMNAMFEDCESLIKLDLSNLDASKVVSTNHMFAGCQSLKELNLGNRFSEWQFACSEKPFDGVSRNLKIISQNVDAINLGFKNESIRPSTEGKDFNWKPKNNTKTNKAKRRNNLDTPDGR